MTKIVITHGLADVNKWLGFRDCCSDSGGAFAESG